MDRLRSIALVVALAAAAGSAAATDTPDAARLPGPELAAELERSRTLLRSALDDALPQGLTLVDLEMGYLSGQGVLVIADLARPWYRRQGGGLDIDAEITSLEQIPDMVHGILRELDLGLSRHQVDDLHTLRGLRDDQQAVRAERRVLRAELRELRRQRLAAQADGAAAQLTELDRQLSALEARLEAAAERERALERAAARKRGEVAAAPSAPPPPPPPPAALDQAVARVMCGTELDITAAADEHLNVVMRQADTSRYYVFALNRVRACQRGDIETEELLADSVRYGGE